MDLEALAETLGGMDARLAASRWLAELRGAGPDGATGASHIVKEANLPIHDEGRQAISRFAQAIAASGGGDPVGWYHAALENAALDLPVHGPNASR